MSYALREGGKPEVNDKGDTLKLVQVTDRERLSSKADVRSQKVLRRAKRPLDLWSLATIGTQESRADVRVVRDTVYIQKDSLSVEDKKIGLSASADGGSKKSGFLTYVKWIFALICAIIGLIIVVKVCSLRR